MHTLFLSFCQALLFIFFYWKLHLCESKYLDEILFVHHMCLCVGVYICIHACEHVGIHTC